MKEQFNVLFHTYIQREGRFLFENRCSAVLKRFKIIMFTSFFVVRVLDTLRVGNGGCLTSFKIACAFLHLNIIANVNCYAPYIFLSVIIRYLHIKPGSQLLLAFTLETTMFLMFSDLSVAFLALLQTMLILKSVKQFLSLIKCLRQAAVHGHLVTVLWRHTHQGRNKMTQDGRKKERSLF